MVQKIERWGLTPNHAGGWLLPESTLFVVVGCLAVIAKGACKIAREAVAVLMIEII